MSEEEKDRYAEDCERQAAAPPQQVRISSEETPYGLGDSDWPVSPGQIGDVVGGSHNMGRHICKKFRVAMFGHARPCVRIKCSSCVSYFFLGLRLL